MAWSWRARPGPVPGHGGGDGVGPRRAGPPERGLVFTGVQHEGLVELVIRLGQLAQYRVDQTQGPQGQLGQRPDADGVPDLGGYQAQERPGGAGRRARQVPDLPGGAGVGTQGGQAGGDVGDVAVGMRQVRAADEVGATAGQRVAEYSLAERGPCGDAGAEEVRGPPDCDPDP